MACDPASQRVIPVAQHHSLGPRAPVLIKTGAKRWVSINPGGTSGGGGDSEPALHGVVLRSA
ncbi:hypothetical protein RR48_02027 [Papilio machaon]|uniref:Uncharacterized protein n=1 Tax=Papilio machaon TaxID=76193 RepID=A0A0N0PEV6_PAPMA|nr:hypothetical protein RR48_02027 [Papilio machaon]